MFWGVFGYGGSCSRHRRARHWLADLPLRERVTRLVFHTAGFQLEHDRLHGRRHVLGLRHRLRCRQPVHGLLRLEVSGSPR